MYLCDFISLNQSINCCSWVNMSKQLQNKSWFLNKMIKRLIKKYKSLKCDYLNRTSREKWDFVLNIGQFVLTLHGVPFLDHSFKIKWYSFGSLAAAIDFLGSSLYTIWYFADTPIKSILITSMFGTVIPVNNKIIHLSDENFHF